MPVWLERDHFYREWALRQTTMQRLKKLAEWGAYAAIYYDLDVGEERREQLIVIWFARYQRIFGWIEDCPEPTHLAPRGRKSQGR